MTQEWLIRLVVIAVTMPCLIALAFTEVSRYCNRVHERDTPEGWRERRDCKHTKCDRWETIDDDEAA